MVSQLWIRKNCSMFKILIFFCLVLSFKLVTNQRRMKHIRDYYKKIYNKSGKIPEEKPLEDIAVEEAPQEPQVSSFRFFMVIWLVLRLPIWLLFYIAYFFIMIFVNAFNFESN